MKKLTSLLAIALCFSINAAHAVDVVDCTTGQTLKEWGNSIFGKFKYFPTQVLDARIANTIKAGRDVTKAIKEFQSLCSAIQSKDGVDAYFYVIGKLSAGLPMGPYISAEINAGKAIIKEANRIAADIAYSGLYSLNGIGTYFNVRVAKKPARYFWQQTSYYSAFEINQKIESAVIVYRTGNSKISQESQKLWGCADDLCLNKNNGQTIFQIQIADALQDVVDLTEAWLKINWTNGQSLYVPLHSGYVSASGNKFDLEFAENNKWYEYMY